MIKLKRMWEINGDQSRGCSSPDFCRPIHRQLPQAAMTAIAKAA
jgi:hypothetical protein